MTVEATLRRFDHYQPEVYQELEDSADPSIRTRETSFVPTTNEITAMISATRNDYWSGLWYELLQGALDYNNSQQGPPDIVVYLKDPVRQVEYAAFLSLAGDSGFDYGQVARVEVRNHLRSPKEGLKPTHIARMEHVQTDDSRTLGEHGRGLSIASTAIVGGGLGTSIDYCSRTPELGTWIGKGIMITDPDDSSATPYFGLKYKRLESEGEAGQTEMTIIGVNEPVPELVEALKQLSVNFLPASPHYRFCRMERGTIQADASRLTMFVGAMNKREATDTSVAFLHAKNAYGLPLDDHIKETEPTRVEILPPLFGEEGPCTYVYTDGLKVKTEKKWALPWSFWGFKHANDGYRAGRTNDSVRLAGNPRALIGDALQEAPADVLEIVLSHNIGTNETAEGELDTYELDPSELSVEGRVRFSQAWNAVLERMGHYPTGVLIAGPSSTLPASGVHTDGRPIIVINSKAFLNVLENCIPGQQSYSEALRRERYEMERELERQREAHRRELQRQKEEREADIKQALQQDRERRGVSKEAVPTDEVIKVGNPEDPQVARELLFSKLLHELAFHEGLLVEDGEDGSMSFDLNPARFDRIPRNANDELGELSPVFRNFVALYGEGADLEIRIVKGKETTYYAFDRQDRLDTHGNISIAIRTGELIHPGHDMVRISFRPRARSETNERALRGYADFRTELINTALHFQGPDHRINYELYADSPYGKAYPAIDTRIRMRAEMDALLALQQQIVGKYGSILQKRREQRRLAGVGEEHEYGVDHTRLLSLLEREREAHRAPSLPSYRDTHPEREVSNERLTGLEDVLFLVDPRSHLGLSRRSHKRRREMGAEAEEAYYRSLAERITNEAIRTQYTPDFTMFTGPRSDIVTAGYLVNHISSQFSDVADSQFEYMALPRRKFALDGRVAVTFGKTIKRGSSGLVHPPGFKPMGYYHADPEVNITFSMLPGKGMYSFRSEADIPKGLIFYYEPDYDSDTSEPDEKERAGLVRDEELGEGWRELVTLLRAELGVQRIDDKTATDLLLHAWTLAFTYSDTQDSFDQYKDLAGVAFTEKIINLADGNCGYAARGFTGLCKAVGLPVREIGSYLSGTGHFDQGKNYHAMNEVYIGGRWVLIEPQSGYVDRQIKLGTVNDIPKHVREPLRAIVKKLPRTKFNYVEELTGGTRVHMEQELVGVTEIPDPEESRQEAWNNLQRLERRAREYRDSIKGTFRSLGLEEEESESFRALVQRHWRGLSASATGFMLATSYAHANREWLFSGDTGFADVSSTPLPSVDLPEGISGAGLQWGSSMETVQLYLSQLERFSSANQPGLYAALGLLGMTAALLGGKVALREKVKVAQLRKGLEIARQTADSVMDSEEQRVEEMRRAIATETEQRLRQELLQRWLEIQEEIRREVAEIASIEKQFQST